MTRYVLSGALAHVDCVPDMSAYMERGHVHLAIYCLLD